MFDEILRLIANGEPLTMKEVAKKLMLDNSMVLQALADLLRMGYLERREIEDEPSCESGCGGCSGCATTIGIEPVRLHITDKGKRKVNRSYKKID